MKLNSDGSLLSQNGSAACRGILRDHLGRHISSFSCNVGSCSIVHAKLWRILNGIKLTVSKGIRKLIIEIDSLTSINMLNSGCPTTHLATPLVKDIEG